MAAEEPIDQPAQEISAADRESPSGAESMSSETQWNLGVNLLMLAAFIAASSVFFAKRWHRFPSAPQRDSAGPISVPTGAMMFVAMMAVGIFGTWIAQQFLAKPPEDAGADEHLAWQGMIRIGGYASQAIMIAWYMRLWAAWPRGAFQNRRCSVPAAFVIGAASLLLWMPASHLAGNVGAYIQQIITHSSAESIAHETLKSLANANGGWPVVLTAVIAVLAAPIFEEVMYRGILQRTFAAAGLGVWARIVLTSVVFTLIHLEAVEPYALSSLFVLSLGFGWTFERTGRLAAPIAMHMAFNAVNLGMLWLNPPV